MTQQKNDVEQIIVHGDPDLEDLIPGFLEHRLMEAKQILDFLESKDFESIGQRGHSLKGLGGGYGFDEITRIGSLIEQAANRQDVDEVRNQVAQLQKYINCVEVVYDE